MAGLTLHFHLKQTSRHSSPVFPNEDVAHALVRAPPRRLLCEKYGLGAGSARHEIPEYDRGRKFRKRTYCDNLTIKMDHGLQFDAYPGFTEGLEAVGLGLLGQLGFFSNDNVLFDYSASEYTPSFP
jgi:hypothetical protein